MRIFLGLHTVICMIPDMRLWLLRMLNDVRYLPWL